MTTDKENEMTIEFTDRYGGRAPSWLRGCHDDCEAMGWVPVFVAQPDDTGLTMEDERDPKLLLLWEAAHSKSDEETCDGWHFVKCAGCDGSGRVSWFVTVARVPRWLWKGVRFYRWAMKPASSPDGWTWRMRFRNYLNAAFLEDIRRIRR